jgi:hypothetical protein
MRELIDIPVSKRPGEVAQLDGAIEGGENTHLVSEDSDSLLCLQSRYGSNTQVRR